MTRRKFITNLNNPRTYTVNRGASQPPVIGDPKMKKRDLTGTEYKQVINHAMDKVRRKAHKDEVKAAGGTHATRAKLKRGQPVEAEESEVDLVDLMQGGTLQRAFCSSFQETPFDPSDDNDY